MRIAVLMTNTDDSAFAGRHPKDGEKFRNLLEGVRPDWQFTVFNVAAGEFPAEDARFDGWIITGSPASVHDPDFWVARLLDLIRRIVTTGAPLFGACFGHQAIALALGGAVGVNPGGWVLGLTETGTAAAPWITDPGSVRLYAAHRGQVTRLPEGAEVLGGNADCPLGSFRIGGQVFATQYHPEMTPGFIAALTEHLAGKLPERVVGASRASLTRQAETERFARWIVAFFEQAQESAAKRSIAVT